MEEDFQVIIYITTIHKYIAPFKFYHIPLQYVWEKTDDNPTPHLSVLHTES